MGRERERQLNRWMEHKIESWSINRSPAATRNQKRGGRQLKQKAVLVKKKKKEREREKTKLEYLQMI